MTANITKVKTTRQGWVVSMHNETLRCMDRFGFTVQTCGKCGGVGYLAGFEFSDGARCWGCNGNGYKYGRRVLPVVQQFNTDHKFKQELDIAAAWNKAGVKIEADVAELMLAQVEAYNAKVSNKDADV